MSSETTVTTRCHKIAERLTGLGIAIAPGKPGDRLSYFDEWQKQATTLMSEVDEWMTTGYPLPDGPHVVTPDHNWICVAKIGGVGCLDIDDYAKCLEMGMPPIPEGVFTVDSAGSKDGNKIHLPFISTPETDALRNRAVHLDPDDRESPKIFELKVHNVSWCGPWQARTDGGVYKPRDSKAPLQAGLAADLIAWIAAHTTGHSEHTATDWDFHEDWDQDKFLEHNQCEYQDEWEEAGTFYLNATACPICEEASRQSGRGCQIKFMFSGKGYGFTCKFCGIEGDGSRKVFEEKMAEKYDWEPWDEPIYTDEGTDWLEELTPVPVPFTARFPDATEVTAAITPAKTYQGPPIVVGGHEKCYRKDCACGMEHADLMPAEPKSLAPTEYVIFAGMEGTTELSLIGRRAYDVVMRKQRWTWEGRIPEGSPTLFTGPVGKGKTMASLSVVYCVTTGHDWPDGAKNTMGPRSVLIAATEDDIETTITPRLAALGADMSRITFIECVGSKEKGGKEKKKQLALKDHTKLLRATLKKNPEIALIVLDPITGFYGKADGNNNSEVRPMIQDLNKVCQELRITIIGIVHENKQKDVSAVNQILGAGALSQVVRSGLRFSSDPDNRGGLICASIKTNLTKAGGGLRFKIEGVDVTLDNGEVTNVGRIVWGEQHELTADDVMGGGTEEDRQNQMGRPPAQTQKACELITTFWANGPRLLTDGHKVREEADISESTWKQAAKQLGLEYKKIEKDWWGRLPFSPGTESQQLWWSRRCPAKDPKLNDFPA